MPRETSPWKPAVTVLLITGTTGGCDRGTIGGVATALSEREQLDFNYLLLQPNGDDLYALRMNYATGCTDYLFDANQLSDMLRTKQFELTRTLVGAPSGVFAASNMNPAYSEARLADVLSNPDRFTGAFSFLAKPDPASDQILLVWDGDMVLRTDL